MQIFRKDNKWKKNHVAPIQVTNTDFLVQINLFLCMFTCIHFQKNGTAYSILFVRSTFNLIMNEIQFSKPLSIFEASH